MSNAYTHLIPHATTALERVAITALQEHRTQAAAAAALGWSRERLQSRLRAVQARAHMNEAFDATVEAHLQENPEPAPDSAPVIRGSVHVAPNNPPPPPAPGVRPGTAVYLLTAAQNNTYVHEAFLDNLEAYARLRGATIMVSRFSYDVASYGKKAVKAGREASAESRESLWYDPRILPYVCDDPKIHGSCRWQLAPDLLWCAELNILPTAERPLSGLESYARGGSGIFPHAKIALESLPVTDMTRPPRFNYTTGTVTQRNYIAKKEGFKGEFHHQFGALVVEVELATGDWWVRQLNADDDGSFYDLWWRVADGKVDANGHPLLAFQPGDIHASEIDPQVADVLWGVGGPGAIDILRPQMVFWHDTMSMRNRGHHEIKSFGSRYAKWRAGENADSVEREIELTALLLQRAHRPWCTTVVVSSNHDRHLERWLEEADYRQDPVNARFFLEAQLARVQAIDAGQSWDGLEWAMRRWFGARGQGLPALFLPRDRAFLIGPPGRQVNCGSHGDDGPNGARGNAGSLSKLDMRMNTGHAHSACLRKGLAVAGVCNRRLPYCHGPSSWSVSHTITYVSAKRAILTARGPQGKLWL